MNEPTLKRIRKARQQISAQCGHDPYKLVEYYMELQKQYQHKLVPPPPKSYQPALLRVN